MNYLNARQLADRLGVTVQTVYNLIREGIIPAGVKIGKSRRWDWDAVKNCIDNNKQEA